MGTGYKIENLTQSVGQEWPAPIIFKNLNLEIEKSSFHMILGSSGGGKSTLLKTMAGVWKPLAGQVFVEDIKLWSQESVMPNQKAAVKIGYAFQNNALFSSMRVIENISFPLLTRKLVEKKSDAHDIGMEWLKKVGLEESAWILPQEMSGGMQKRLAIVRAVALKPEYLFLDDPTAGLDPMTSLRIMKMLLDLLKEGSSTVVMVTNDVDRAKDTPAQIHFLDDGNLYSSGQTEYSILQERFL